MANVAEKIGGSIVFDLLLVMVSIRNSYQLVSSCFFCAIIYFLFLNKVNIMSDEYRKLIGIPDEHSLKQVDMEWKGARRGQDTDVYIFDEINQSGEVVARYEVTSSTSIYPPFKTHTSYSKINTD